MMGMVEEKMPVDSATSEVIRDELDDELSETSQVVRKLNSMVNYVELSEDAGAFKCGNCRFVMTADSFCMKAEVRAHVDEEKGSCNFFKAAPESGLQVVFPPQKD